VLVDGQVDHTTGLYMLREATRPWRVWCTDAAHADLTRANPVLGVLEHYCGVVRQRIELSDDSAERAFAVDDVPNVRWLALPVAGKPAPYSPNRQAPITGDNVAPGLAAIDAHLWRRMQSAHCVLVDGTFWSDDEMSTLGLSQNLARDMGHLPQSGAGGMLEWLERLPSGTRKILIHINNTNPILDEDSPARAELTRRDIEVAWDGMEIAL
jgi:pyrroloquinoline quinone biosynthesis protein B